MFYGLIACALFLGAFQYLFGLEQVCRTCAVGMLAADRFRTPALYRVVRHPIMMGFLSPCGRHRS